MKNNRITIAIFILFCLVSIHSFSQNKQTSDTTNFPYWIQMMQDENANFFDVQRAFEMYWDGREITKGCGYKPFKRWEYRMQDHIYLDGTRLPADHVMKEVQKFKAGTQNNPILTPGSQSNNLSLPGYWTPLGPKYMPTNGTSQPNGLGRINGIAFHPLDSNTIYIGAPSGGFWKSADYGQTWRTTTDTLISLGVSDIAVHPDNPDIIFIGTGDRDAGDAAGIGVMKSTDGGESWVFINTGLGYRTISKIVLHPHNPDTMLVATNAGIYRSLNGGQSWTKTSTTANYKDLVFRPNDPSILYASTAYKFFKSSDIGGSWNQITSGLPSSGTRGGIAVTADDSDYVYFIVTNSRSFKGLYLSTDAGVSFSTQSTTPNIMDYSSTGSGTGGQAWYDLDMAVDQNNKSIVYVGGINIFKSTDYGVNWSINAHWTGSGGGEPIHADQHCLEFDPINNYLFSGNDGGIYFSRNGGSKWIEISSGLEIAQVYKIGQSAIEKNTVINGYQDNGTSVYYGFGTWNTEIGGDGMECIADYTDANYLYGALYYGDIRRSSNHGMSFSRIARNGTNGINESGGWITPYILDEDSSSIMFIGYKNIWRSENIKESSPGNVEWKKISDTLAGSNTSNIRVLEQSPSNPNILYAARYDYKLFRTDSARGWNPQWTDLSASLPYNTYATAIEAHPTIDSIVYMALYGRIYKSTNFGSSWTNISANLPVITYLSIVYDTTSNEGLYVGSRSGVYFKDASMSNWILFNDGLPLNANVTELEIYYDQTHPTRSKIRAATYGRGLWESNLYSSSTVKPVASFIASDSLGCVGQVLRFEDYSINEPTSVYWKFSPPAVTFMKETDSSYFNPIVRFDTEASYSIEYIVSNSAGTDTFRKNSCIQIFDPLDTANCTTSTTNSAGYAIGIYNVKLSNLNFSSPSYNGINSYHDYSCEGTALVEAGETYYMDVTVGYLNSEYVEAYIDYNNDGDFIDTGEQIMSTGKATDTHRDTVVIPANPYVSNTKLRMRVISDYSSINNDPCKTLSYGESEDFGVYINEIKSGFTFSDSIICQGQKVVFTDTSHGLAASINWDFGAGAIPRYANGKGPHQVQFNNYGVNQVKLTLNSSISAFQNIHIYPYPQTSLNFNSDSSLCFGEQLKVTCTDALFNSNLNYQWFKDNNSQSSYTDSTLQIASVSLNDSGNYYCVASNQGCADTSRTFKINVNSLPILSFSINDTDQCLYGNSFSFQNASSNAISYKWNFGNGYSSTNTNPTHSYMNDGIYTVTLVATSAKNCQDSMARAVIIHSMPVANFTANDTDQCVDQNHFTFINLSSNAINYNWDFDDGQNSTQKNTSHFYITPATYQVKLVAESDHYCFDTMTKTVYVRQMPSISFSVNDIDQCLNSNNFIFTNTSTALQTTHWKFGDGMSSSLQNPVHSYADTGLFMVKLIGTDSYSCVDSANMQIRVYQSPIINFNLSDSQLCFAAHQLTVTDFSDGDYSIIYFGDGDSALTPIANKTYNSAGIFQVMVKSFTNNGCMESGSKQIEIMESPVADFSRDDSAMCFKNNLFTFYNQSAKTDTLPSWQLNDKLLQTGDTLWKSFDITGQYSIELIARNGLCFDSIEKSILVYADPIANFITSNVCLIDSMHFVNLSSTADTQHIKHYHWEFSSSLTSNDVNPVILFAYPGAYSIQLVAETYLGCVDTFTGSYEVYPMPSEIFNYSYLAEGEVSFNPEADASHSFKWYFGDGDSSILRSPVHLYPHNLDYQVDLHLVSDENCSSSSMDTVRITNKTSIYNDPENESRLNVYPNPFNKSIKIEFTIKQREDVLICLYDAVGKKIKTITQEELNRGNHQIILDEELRAGQYLLKIVIGNKEVFKQIIKY